MAETDFSTARDFVRFWRAAGPKQWFGSSAAFDAEIELRFGSLQRDASTGKLDSCPDVRLDVLVTDEQLDIVAGGFDAGVRLGEVVERDMIAVPVSADQRQIVVAPPAYRRPAHRCTGATCCSIAASAGGRRQRSRRIVGSSPKRGGSSTLRWSRT